MGQDQNALIPAPPTRPYGHEWRCEMSDWIEWTGGECPVPEDTQVEIRLGENGPENATGPAGHWGWSHAGFKNLDAHITAYRVVS